MYSHSIINIDYEDVRGAARYLHPYILMSTRVPAVRASVHDVILSGFELNCKYFYKYSLLVFAVNLHNFRISFHQISNEISEHIILGFEPGTG